MVAIGGPGGGGGRRNRVSERGVFRPPHSAQHTAAVTRRAPISVTESGEINGIANELNWAVGQRACPEGSGGSKSSGDRPVSSATSTIDHRDAGCRRRRRRLHRRPPWRSPRGGRQRPQEPGEVRRLRRPSPAHRSATGRLTPTPRQRRRPHKHGAGQAKLTSKLKVDEDPGLDPVPSSQNEIKAREASGPSTQLPGQGESATDAPKASTTPSKAHATTRRSTWSTIQGKTQVVHGHISKTRRPSSRRADRGPQRASGSRRPSSGALDKL